ncbi:MAG: DUF6259 domain-containing protein [Bacteroidales bacterium]|nr:DUF6259 domain-containing protein [Bacteroidales bacterium]
MKKSFFILFIFSGILCLTNLQLLSASEKLELKTTEATLSIDQKGNLKVIKDKGQIIQINTSINNLWKITLKNNLNGKESVFVPDKNVRIKKAENVLQLISGNFSIDNKTIPVEAEFTISVKDDAFCFSGSLKSDSKEWIFKELTYPDIEVIKINDKNIKIYWPGVLGQCFDNPAKFGSRSFEYPGNDGTMQWFSVNSSTSGIYIGGHDPLQGSKKFTLSYNESGESFSTDVRFPVYTTEFTIPEVMIKPYQGSWHIASKFYRGWYDKNFKIASVSEWARKSAGYMLTIFKQQNGDVMYNYKDIDRVCDIAKKLNFDLVGIWGRGVGGHDRLYPNYMPDNLMGGRGELKKAIERAHQRGFKIIVYSNGTIMDASTDFYVYNGIETILLNERKQPELEYYVKHDNSTPVIFALGCPGSALWRKTILDLATDAQSLGVDAFYIDEVAWRGPLMCYSKNHDHALPQEAYTKYRVKMMHDIRAKMKETDPEFTIMTEGINDAMLVDVDIFQGVPGNINSPGCFPEMFRYTFPEAIGIALNSDPSLRRYDLNHEAIFGLRHEIMSRYQGDVDYLNYGKLPSEESYAHVNDTPDIKQLNEVPAEEVTSYTHSMFQFENDNADYFRSGKFIDEDGIKITGDEILGKGFLNGSKMGVVVWNKNLSEKRDFSVSVPGYKLVKATEPGKSEVNASSSLDANSVRLLIFEKD